MEGWDPLDRTPQGQGAELSTTDRGGISPRGNAKPWDGGKGRDPKVVLRGEGCWGEESEPRQAARVGDHPSVCMNSLFWDAEERATSLCKQQGGRLEVEGWSVEVQL